MVTGVEYAHSRQKRIFDLHVAALLSAPAHLATTALRASNCFHDEPHFVQARVGAFGNEIDVYKIRTMDETGDVINSLAGAMRRTGLDETLQYKNILNGSMSAVGHRPIVKSEHDTMFDGVPGRLADDWLSYVAPTKPGQVSTFALESHLGFDDSVNQRQERLEKDIFDVLHGSLDYDARLVMRTIGKAASNKMKHGRISHE